MFSLVKKLFGGESMLPKGHSHETLPPDRELYSSFARLAIPSVLEMVLISLINMADTVMVSSVGTNAVAAVGLVGQPRFIMLCFFWALSIGITAVVARRKGEERKQDANLALRSTLVISLLLSLILAALFLPFSVPLMRFAGAIEGETLEDATEYFVIVTLALPFNALSMIICAGQRGAGYTKLTMQVNITSNLVNILFNFLLINGIGPFPRLEVKGAAIATFIGLFMGFVLSVISLLGGRKKQSFLALEKHASWRIDRTAGMDVVRIALGAMVEQICLRIGFFAYSKIVADLGTDAFAAHQIDMQFLNLSFSFADGLGVAGTALVGQMLGRRRRDLAHIYGSLTQRISFMISLVLASLCILLRAPLVSMFINPDNAGPGVREMAENVMIVVGIFQPVQMISVVAAGALRGAGDVKYTAKVMALTVTLIRPVLAILSVKLLKNTYGVDVALLGAWLAGLADMIVRMILMTRRYRAGSWEELIV